VNDAMRGARQVPSGGRHDRHVGSLLSVRAMPT
jgi:hypothetical protein